MMSLYSKLRTLIKKERERSPHKRAIVFWYDPEGAVGDLSELTEELKNDELMVWEVTKNNAFATKYQVEVERPETSFLLYAPFTKPQPEKNSLLDILLYGAEFKNNEQELIAEELSLAFAESAPFLQQYAAFFRSKQRKDRFKQLCPSHGGLHEWKGTVFAVLVRAQSSQVSDVLRVVLTGGLEGGHNPLLEQIKKFAPIEDFFIWLYDAFGLSRTNEPSIKDIFDTLVYAHVTVTTPEMKHYLPSFPTKSTNACYVFVEDELQDQAGREVWRPYIERLENDWKIAEILHKLPREQALSCVTFPIVDEIVFEWMAEILLNYSVNGLDLKEMISQRLKGFWAQGKQIEGLYHCFDYAYSLTRERYEGTKAHYRRGGAAWVEAYAKHDFQIDQDYRKFIEIYRHMGMPEVGRQVFEGLVFWYEKQFLAELASYTEEYLEEGAAMWPIPHILQQDQFYVEELVPIIENKSDRVFVIISDALRYEAGMELASHLARRLNAEVEIKPMQAVAPTCTKLGMAALLPGKITNLDERGAVYVEEIPATTLRSREQILQQTIPESAAFRLDDFIQLRKEEGLKSIRGKRLLYFYHNRIDAIGEQQATESYVLEDVSRAIVELERAVAKLTGTFGAKRIFITADHGFLYQYSAVQDGQLTDRVEGKVTEEHRRYVLGKELSVPEGTRHLSLSYLGMDLDAVVAKGVNRLKARGGVKFVHGGMMPQEAIVPLIHYREVHGHHRKKMEKRVDLRVALSSRVITQFQFNVLFFQEQKVSHDQRPRHIRAAFYHKDERISNEIILVFDSEEEPADRHIEVGFTLIEGEYELGETCVLRLEDVTGTRTALYKEENFELRVYPFD